MTLQRPHKRNSITLKMEVEGSSETSLST